MLGLHDTNSCSYRTVEYVRARTSRVRQHDGIFFSRTSVFFLSRSFSTRRHPTQPVPCRFFNRRERHKLCGHETTTRRYYTTLRCSEGSRQRNAMYVSPHWVPQALHTHCMKERRRNKQRKKRNRKKIRVRVRIYVETMKNKRAKKKKVSCYVPPWDMWQRLLITVQHRTS